MFNLYGAAHEITVPVQIHVDVTNCAAFLTQSGSFPANIATIYRCPDCAVPEKTVRRWAQSPANPSLFEFPANGEFYRENWENDSMILSNLGPISD